MANIPKTQQVYFFCTPEETEELLAHIQESGLLVISAYSREAMPEPAYPPFTTTVFITDQSLLSQVELHKVTEGRYAIDPTVSPVIEFNPSVARNGELSRSRLYTRFGYIGRDEWVQFPETLVMVHKTIEKYLEKHILTKERCFGAFISKNASLLKISGVQLVQF